MEYAGCDTKALRSVAAVYAGKKSVLTAALQYVYQAVTLGAMGRREEGRALEKLAGEKFFELEQLASLLASLGVNPLFTACPPYPVSYFSASGVDYAKSYPAMLEADIALLRSLCVSYSTMQRTAECPEVEELAGKLLHKTREELAHLSEALTASRA